MKKILLSLALVAAVLAVAGTASAQTLTATTIPSHIVNSQADLGTDGRFYFTDSVSNELWTLGLPGSSTNLVAVKVGRLLTKDGLPVELRAVIRSREVTRFSMALSHSILVEKATDYAEFLVGSASPTVLLLPRDVFAPSCWEKIRATEKAPLSDALIKAAGLSMPEFKPRASPTKRTSSLNK